MQSHIYDDVFEEFFGDKVQPYRDAIAEAKAEATEARAKATEAKAEATEAKAEATEARAKATEEKAKRLAAEAQVHRTDELFCSSMRSIIRSTLYSSGKATNLPNDVLNRIERIKSYDFLGELLSIASSPKDDYATFLAALDKGEEQGRFAVSN